MRNIRLDVCYDGTRYSGWQRQTAHDNTIQGKLETALSRILAEPIEISASGRTDTGVHARGQVVNFHTKSAMDCTELLSQLRRYLPEDIGIYCCREVSPRFHARLNALEKTYQYRLWNSDAPCVFERRFVAEFPEELDFNAMQRAAELFLGTLIEVGRGTRSADSIPELFGAKREQAGFLAPGKGLCLMEVRY